MRVFDQQGKVIRIDPRIYRSMTCDQAAAVINKHATYDQENFDDVPDGFESVAEKEKLKNSRRVPALKEQKK